MFYLVSVGWMREVLSPILAIVTYGGDCVGTTHPQLVFGSIFHSGWAR